MAKSIRKLRKMLGSSSRGALAATASAICVLTLLYFGTVFRLGLSVTLGSFLTVAPPSMAPSKNAPEAAECTMKVDKFTPE